MILTWLPLPSFKDSVRALEDAQLGLQRYHVLHVIEKLHDVEVSDLPEDYCTSWVENNGGLELSKDGSLDRVCAMWAGHEMQLLEYGLEACDEWASRKGKRDWLYEPLAKHLDWATSETSRMEKPPWFGDVNFHLSHQAALVRLNPEFYCRTFLIDVGRKLIWPQADG